MKKTASKIHVLTIFAAEIHTMPETHANIPGRRASVLRMACALALIIGAAIPGYMLAKYGVNYTDEPYQILNAMDYRHSPLSALSSYLYGLYGNATGFGWLQMRYIALSIVNLAILAGGWYLWRSSGNALASGAVTAAALLGSGMSRMTFNLFGWDNLSVLLIVMTMLAALRFLRKPGAGITTGAAALTALAILSRLPNLSVVIAMAAVIIAGSRNPGERRRLLFLYLIATLLLTISAVSILFGSPLIYIETLSRNIISQHNIKSLIAIYAVDGCRLLFIVCTVRVMLRTIDFTMGWKAPKTLKGAILVIIGATLFVSLHFLSYFVSDIYYASALVIVALLYYVLPLGNNRSCRRRLLQAATVAIFGLALIAGSNLGVRKFISWPLIPVAAAFLLKKCTFRRLAVYGAVLFIPLLLQLRVVCLRQSFLDAGTEGATACIEHGPASGLYTTPGIKEEIEDIAEARASLPPGTDMAVAGEGTRRFLYEYLFGSRSLYAPHNWSETPLLDSKEYIEWIETKVANRKDNPLAILCLRRSDGQVPGMEKMLDGSSAERRRYANFTLYLFQPQTH